MAVDVEFAVVDVETTGFSPAKNDRVIEIAIVRLDGAGRVLDEYATLVNPRRDVGPTYIHSISARQLRLAPEFTDIVGDVLQRLAGAIFAAHNVRFDMTFVRSEVERAGVAIPSFPYLCTMRLAHAADPTIPSRRLGQVCEHFGITIPHAHSAMDDARATASLLSACIRRLQGSNSVSLADLDALGVAGVLTGRNRWPAMPSSGRTCRREEATARIENEPSYISRLLAKLPPANDATPEMDEYVALLDRVLEDRRVTAEEADALASVASELGITREQAIAAHEQYVSDLTRVALADGILTESERKDLNDVRHLLNVSEERFSSMFADSAMSQSRHADTHTTAAIPSARSLEGKTICFTGQLGCCVNGDPVTRERTERIATEKGMVVKETVTKKLDYLVTADPDSMSGKAEKAKRYGVRIIAEPVFWQMVGVSTD
ncbi:MAG: hypothetical protein KAV82_01700 [Phycisphaerae bacterium]|nr:hypothetical protein [Phycisphaerae bacterium]